MGVLLLVAVWMPTLLGTHGLLSATVATTVAMAATVGGGLGDPARRALLERNGARPFACTLLGTAEVAGPAAVAVAIGLVSSTVVATGPAPVEVVLVAGIVPLVVAFVAAGAIGPRRPARRWVTVLLGVLVALTAPTIVVPLLLAAWLLARTGRRPLAAGVLTLGAVGLAVAIAASVGRVDTWWDLSFALLFAAAPLVLAVAWVGGIVIGVAAEGLRRTGPVGRLAAVPLQARRAHLGPIAAVVALVAALAAAEAVVGASFGAREERRVDVDRVLGLAGSSAEQAIVVTTTLTPDEARATATSAAAGLPVLVGVVGRLGTGGTQVEASAQAETRADEPQTGLGLDLQRPPTVHVDAPVGPTWVGVATAGDLAALGLAAQAEALEQGRAIVLNPEAVDGATVEVVTGSGSHTLPAVPAGWDVPAHLLPAVVVGPDLAADLGEDVRGGRVVVAPASADADHRATREVADAVHDRATATTSLDADLDAVDGFVEHLEAQSPVVSGDEALVLERGGPLNAVPYLASTAEQGADRAQGLLLAALVVAVAGTALVLSRFRSEDAVLEVQGASTSLRAAISAAQAATVSVAATVVGAAAGIGLPVLAMWVYGARDRGDDLPDVPVVVPGSIIVLLVALPVVAGAAAALVVAARGRPSSRLLVQAAAD